MAERMDNLEKARCDLQAKLNQDIRQLQNEIASLRDDIRQLQNDNASLRDDIRQLQNENVPLRNENEKLTRKVAELENRLVQGQYREYELCIVFGMLIMQ